MVMPPSLLATLALTLAWPSSARPTCDEAFPHLGPAAGDASQAAPADAPHLTRLVDFLRPETTAWWQYTLNTLSNTVPCAVPWSCREGFLDEWDPDLFDWDGECE
eukprot:COSAG04_NODE_13_length_42806_cov_92.030323_12_plen_105_part_00